MSTKTGPEPTHFAAARTTQDATNPRPVAAEVAAMSYDQEVMSTPTDDETAADPLDRAKELRGTYREIVALAVSELLKAQAAEAEMAAREKAGEARPSDRASRASKAYKRLDTIRRRRDFVRDRAEERRKKGEPPTLDATEASALTWALSQMIPASLQSLDEQLPPLGVPVTLHCDSGDVIGIRIGPTEYRCACGNPDPLTGVTAWERRTLPNKPRK